MTNLKDADTMIYRVVKNHEEQYSIWPKGKDLPLGWVDDGFDGSKQSCLDHIDSVWTDMRPLSLRKQMEEMAKQPHLESKVEPEVPSGPSLVERLCSGEHEIRLVLRPENTLSALKSMVERGFAQIEFTNTRGGTVLGFQIDSDLSDTGALLKPDSESNIRLSGSLTLNFQKVRCTANLSTKTFDGKGKLELIN